jgi:calcium-translocating P-type ATPase
MPSHPPLWTLSTQQVYETLSTTAQGLSEAEIAIRIKQHGFNELPEPAKRSLLLRFTDQLTHFMALLLWVAGGLAFVSGTPEVGWAIWAVIWVNAGFSFWQEFQAEQALTALNQMLPAKAQVYRHGTLQSILVREIVPGDPIQLEEGDRIPADARLVSAQSLYVDLSVLTGESLPVARSDQAVSNAQMRPSEAGNLVFAGATVSAGRGLAIVYATGTQTEFGQVAHLTTTVQREPSTLEVQIDGVVHVITTIAIGMGIAVFLLTNLLVGMETKESFIFAIGIIVAFVPEGLLPTVTLALAMGVKRMAKQNALVRRLSAVETLSATTVICTDKTGTLTKNQMTVCRLWIPATEITVTGVGYDPTGGEVQVADERLKSQVKLMLAGAALCSNARLNHPAGSSQWQEIGDPTEAALLVAALKQGLKLEELQHQFNRTQEIPFDSLRRMMSVVLKRTGADDCLGFELAGQSSQPESLTATYLIVTKGSPLDVLNCCQQILQDGKLIELSAATRAEVTATNDRFASHGYRVLGIAAKQQTEQPLEAARELEQNLIFVGLIAMIDPPRVEVAGAIAKCHQAGIQVTMVTGDYGLTAEAIAQQIGMVEGKARIVTGEEMGHLSDAQLAQILHQKSGLIFARFQPEQKLKLVQAYISMGQIVAVTGDGVNDAPALRAAHIGIAMGLNGTDVAREAADIVLIDDNFATIVSAIEQGRAVYQNIRKFITYILSSNVPELLPFLAMVFFKIPPALVILQILAIDLGTDMLPALGLGAEQPEAGTLLQPPRLKSQSLLDKYLLLRAFCFLGLLEGVAGMTGFFLVWWTHGYGIAELQSLNLAILAHSATATQMAIYHQATTVTLVAIVACQIGNVFACRSERTSIFRLGFFSNPSIWLGIAAELVLILSIIYVPFFQKIFATAPLSTLQWSAIIICPPLILVADEIRKSIIN